MCSRIAQGHVQFHSPEKGSGMERRGFKAYGLGLGYAGGLHRDMSSHFTWKTFRDGETGV